MKDESLKTSDIWPAGTRAAVSLSFDDARHSQLDAGLPILDRHGVRATFYLSPPTALPRADEWRIALAHGHELGNHTMTHPCSGNFAWSRDNALEDHTVVSYSAELDQASAFIHDQFGIAPITYAYCCGQKFIGRGAHVHSLVPLVAERFVVGRGFRDESWNDPDYCDLAQTYGIDADTQTFETLRNWVDRAAAAGGWVIFAAHDVSAQPHQAIAPAILDALCAYCANPANGIWIDTTANVGAHVRNWQMSRQQA